MSGFIDLLNRYIRYEIRVTMNPKAPFNWLATIILLPVMAVLIFFIGRFMMNAMWHIHELNFPVHAGKLGLYLKGGPHDPVPFEENLTIAGLLYAPYFAAGIISLFIILPVYEAAMPRGYIRNAMEMMQISVKELVLMRALVTIAVAGIFLALSYSCAMTLYPS